VSNTQTASASDITRPARCPAPTVIWQVGRSPEPYNHQAAVFLDHYSTSGEYHSVHPPSWSRYSSRSCRSGAPSRAGASRTSASEPQPTYTGDALRMAAQRSSSRLTPRAADSPESPRFSALVCAIILSSLGSTVPARRRAADANRWAALNRHRFSISNAACFLRTTLVVSIPPPCYNKHGSCDVLQQTRSR
jgi:hypothetical protein